MTILFHGLVSHDYHQLYLCDAGLPDLPDDYSEAAIARRVVAGPEAIIVHVDREMPVPVTVHLHAGRPTLDLAALDHVAQTAFEAPSGKIVLAGLLAYAPDAPHLRLPSGRLGVLVTFAALGSLSEDGLEGEDAYAIHLWPDPIASGEVTVAKMYPSPPAGRD